MKQNYLMGNGEVIDNWLPELDNFPSLHFVLLAEFCGRNV